MRTSEPNLVQKMATVDANKGDDGGKGAGRKKTFKKHNGFRRKENIM